VRAFPNLFPVLPADEGAHEVVVSSPRHVESVGDLTPEEAAAAVDGWARRSRAVEADPRGLWPFAFVNQGAMAGASLRHTHAQIVGLPFAPPLLVERARGFAGSEECPLCAEIAGAGERVIARDAGMVAWCPPVPPLSGAIRIAPERHVPDWPEAPGAALGPLLARLLRAVDAIAPGRAANVWVHRAPPGGMERYHWHTEIVPRMGTLAGLELGAGVLALTREPAEVATALRGALGSTG
jgi:UDPglucose--hexose-1-phosphate uridylyltransferase